MTAARRPWPLVVRVARADDRDAVLGFATNTWDGWDYMPHAFDRWLDAPDGVMLVGVVGAAATGATDGLRDADGNRLVPGTVIAVVRVAFPAPREAWLEGIRVDPRVRGMNVATDLQVAELLCAEASGTRVVRYATSARNEGSHRLGARGEFEVIVEFLGTAWHPPATESESHQDRAASGFIPEVQQAAQTRRDALMAEVRHAGLVADVAETPDLWRLVSEDQSFNMAARLYEPRPWALEELTEEKFTRHTARGEVVVTRGTNGRPAAVAIIVATVPPAEEAIPRLAVLSGAPKEAFELVERVRILAGEPVRIRYAVGAPLVDDARELYDDAGYEFSDWALHILARPLDEAHPAPSADPSALVLADEPRAATSSTLR